MPHRIRALGIIVPLTVPGEYDDPEFTPNQEQKQATGATNTPQALNTLSGLFVILPILMLVASSLIIRRFPIDEARQKEVRAALEARDAKAGAASA